MWWAARSGKGSSGASVYRLCPYFDGKRDEHRPQGWHPQELAPVDLIAMGVLSVFDGIEVGKSEDHKGITDIKKAEQTVYDQKVGDAPSAVTPPTN